MEDHAMIRKRIFENRRRVTALKYEISTISRSYEEFSTEIFAWDPEEQNIRLKKVQGLNEKLSIGLERILETKLKLQSSVSLCFEDLSDGISNLRKIAKTSTSIEDKKITTKFGEFKNTQLSLCQEVRFSPTKFLSKVLNTIFTSEGQ